MERNRPMRRGLGLLLLLLSLVSACDATSTTTDNPPTPIQIQEIPEIPEIPEVPEIPKIPGAGSADWLKVGARLTYYVAAATIATRSEPTCWPDPNGDYEDAQGNKYRCESMPDDHSEGSIAGGGLERVDVLEVGGNGALVAKSVLNVSPGSSDYLIASMGGERVPGNIVGNLWIHPGLLTRLAVINPSNLNVYTGIREIEGRSYNATVFLSTVPGSYESYVYDRDTGILVAAYVKKAATSGPSGAGGTNLSLMTLRGVRQRNVPGIAGANPSWVAPNKQMIYSGSVSFDAGSGSAPFVQRMDYSIVIGQGGTNWSEITYRQVIHWGGPTTEANGNDITSSAGIYWIDPRALAGLVQGQVLDEDPVTHERMVVVSVQESGGSRLVTISFDLPGNQFLYTYDGSSGALLRYMHSDSVSRKTTDLQLQGVP